ncbi:MAG: 23S rRNA (guanosine(2251)-2'-O)-methyltransferase RlmB [Gammaproteobacteria bacterium]|nr:23S rRNA (guanosine(2251)-2'-O)-methyltransferase RlmB [Gammaproteobacteria bacterium]
MTVNAKTKTKTTAAIVCGFHAVEAELARRAVAEVVVAARRRDERGARLLQSAARVGVTVRRAARAELDQLAGGVKHQGVVARLRVVAAVGEGAPAGAGGESVAVPATAESAAKLAGLAGLNRHLDGLQHPPLLLILDRIQDPHNLGACLRAADGAGADAVILPKDGACRVTPAAARVAAGAAARLPVFRVANLARAMQELRGRGVWLTGADAAAERELYAVDWRAPAAIVLGGEGRGLRRLTRENCDQLARIPLAAGGVASLNAAVAAAVFLFEAVRQRGGD